MKREIDLEDIDPKKRLILLLVIVASLIIGIFVIGHKVGVHDMCSDMGGVAYKSKMYGNLICINHSSLDYCVDEFNGGLHKVSNNYNFTSVNISGY